MDITLVLAVYNKLDLTEQCYKRIRELYPDAPLVISSGGSSDPTHEWLDSLTDSNLQYTYTEQKIPFSENYNRGIRLVKTKKLVLIHNDMVIGKHFLENLERLITEDTILSYTTIEPPIFRGHERPGKVILDMGSDFSDFKWKTFDQYVERNKDNCDMSDGAVFFMSGYKNAFEKIGFFDGETFIPAFAEDDDFLIRAKLAGYKLKTTSCAITYHFVSQTSRFSDEFKNNRLEYELNSNRNFIRKWGMPISSFNRLKYWEQSEFTYSKNKTALVLKTPELLKNLEPFFDKVQLETTPNDYITDEQKYTNYDLAKKFESFDDVNVIVYENGFFSNEDYFNLEVLQLIATAYSPGEYEMGNLKIIIQDN